MKAFLTSISFSLLALLLVGCQSNTYKLQGTAEGLEDGDTLFLTDDMINGTPSDTIIIEKGAFSFKGETDKEAALCMVYSAKRNEINAAFIRNLEKSASSCLLPLAPHVSVVRRVTTSGND